MPLNAQVLISMIMLFFFVYVIIARNWVDNEPFEILAWKMDPKHFEEARARARALAKQKSLPPPPAV